MLPSLSGSCPQYYLCLCPSLLFCGVRGVGVGVEPGCGLVGEVVGTLLGV